MSDFGDDAGRCSNGLNSQKFRDATSEERAVYRRWIRGAIAVYGILFLVVGAMAWISTARTIEVSSLTSTDTAGDTHWTDAHF